MAASRPYERPKRAAARYFQRPDNDHVEYDPTRTSLSGWSANYSVGKQAGGFWRVATGAAARSPGFETNDLGFLMETDYVSPWIWGGYHHTTPSGPFLRYFLNVNSWAGWSFGGENLSKGANVNGSFTLKNFWGGYAGVMREFENGSNTALRGGPILIEEPRMNGWFGLSSDSRKSVQFNLNNNWMSRSESDSWSWNSNVSVNWRPSDRARLNVGPFLNLRAEDRQWVQGLTINDKDEYILGRLDQTTFGLTARVDFAFTPDLSLQVYAQPFVSAGEYGELKAVTNPQADRYQDRFRNLDATRTESGYEADVNGDGAAEALRDPNFNFAQFRSNVVLRWEYRPGSALFLVWAQARDQFEQNGQFDLGRNIGDLFDQDPDNIFMVKFSYWLNP